MIYDLLLPEVKVLYLKMKTSATLQGFCDALRELLDELETNKDTKDSFRYLKNCLDQQQSIWAEQFKNSFSLIKEKLQILKTAKYKGSDKVKEYIKTNEKQIRQGNPNIFAGKSYLEMRFNLLETASKMVAEYGEFDVISEWTKCNRTKVTVVSFEIDPFPEQIILSTIYPETDFGNAFEKRLGNGFVNVKVIPANEYTKRQYEIEQGYVDFDYPLEIEDCRKGILGITSPEIRDKRPSLLLRDLIFYAYWRDLKDADLQLPQNVTDESLNNFYNVWYGKGNLHLSFALKDGPIAVRTGLFDILDRFLIFVLQENQQRDNPDRAFKYAYGRIKEILLCRDLSTRNSYTYAEVTKLVMGQATQDNLSFQLFKANCTAACKHFAKEHDWTPKRKTAQKKMVAPTRSKT